MHKHLSKLTYFVQSTSGLKPFKTRVRVKTIQIIADSLVHTESSNLPLDKYLVLDGVLESIIIFSVHFNLLNGDVLRIRISPVRVRIRGVD